MAKSGGNTKFKTVPTAIPKNKTEGLVEKIGKNCMPKYQTPPPPPPKKK